MLAGNELLVTAFEGELKEQANWIDVTTDAVEKSTNCGIRSMLSRNSTVTPLDDVGMAMLRALTAPLNAPKTPTPRKENEVCVALYTETMSMTDAGRY